MQARAMDDYIAEFAGTMILIVMGNGVCANVNLQNTKGQGSGWLVITAGWGMPLTWSDTGLSFPGTSTAVTLR